MRLLIIHRSTFVVALVLIVLVALMNMPGELVSPLAGSFGGGYTAEYVHGWPWVSLHRTVFYEFSKPGAAEFPDVPKFGVPWLAWTSWEFWQGESWKPRI